MQAFWGGLATSIMQSNELKAAYSRLPGRFFWTGLRRVRPPPLSQRSRDSPLGADADTGFAKSGRTENPLIRILQVGTSAGQRDLLALTTLALLRDNCPVKETKDLERKVEHSEMNLPATCSGPAL